MTTPISRSQLSSLREYSENQSDSLMCFLLTMLPSCGLAEERKADALKWRLSSLIYDESLRLLESLSGQPIKLPEKPASQGTFREMT